MNNSESIKYDINVLKHRLDTETLSQADKQLLLDTIEEKKKDIEKVSRGEHLIIPGNDATIKDRKPVQRTSFLNDSRIML